MPLQGQTRQSLGWLCLTSELLDYPVYQRLQHLLNPGGWLLVVENHGSLQLKVGDRVTLGLLLPLLQGQLHHPNRRLQLRALGELLGYRVESAQRVPHPWGGYYGGVFDSDGYLHLSWREGSNPGTGYLQW
jgi:hypothetical protein